MRLVIYFCFLCALGVCVSATAWSQHVGAGRSDEFVIDYLDVRKGLLSNFVTRTISDDNNLKYFATEGGVSRYDGYGFKSYRPGGEYPQLVNENIETLFKDKDNSIWIGTKSGGLSVLDVKINRIRNYNDILKTRDQRYLRVISLNQDAKGNIWVGTWNKGVFVLDANARKLLAHHPATEPVYKIIRDEHHNIWYISGRMLHKYDPSENRLFDFPTQYIMYDLVQDNVRNKLWMVGNTGPKVHLQSFRFDTQRVQEEPINLEATFMKSIAVDGKGRVWLGSWGDGLFISDVKVTRFQKINTNPQGSMFNNVNYSMILDIDIDPNGIAWLSTAHGGVLILYPNKGFNFMADTRQGGQIDHNTIAIFKTRRGELLIGSLTEGLYRKPADGPMEKISPIADTRINTIYEKDNTLFVGTNRGLYIIKDGNFANAYQAFANDKITAVHLDSQGILWIGSQQRGLKMTRFADDPKLEKCQIYAEEQKGRFALENNRINQIKEDSQGNIWLATYSGLNLLDRTTGAFIPHHQLLSAALPSVIINALYIKGSTLYLATPLGFADLSLTNKKLNLNALYTARNGLTNDFVCAIEEDNTGQFWLSTTTSITRFDPKNKRFVNYDREDGVMINSFHIGSSFKGADGELYFGGANGIIQFRPDQIGRTFSVPKVVWTKLMVNNQAIDVGEDVNGEVILTRSIQYTDEISLSYRQNHLSLNFAANDFFGADNVTYAYQLRGFGDGWVNIGGKNEINFTGLGAGTYELLVKASRNNQDWSPAKKLRIVVGVPPWLSWYAFVFYVCLAVGALLLVRHISVRQARLKADLRIVQIEKEKEHALNEAKINFFTNISHEFRTPLTLIMSPVAEILDDLTLNSKLREKMVLVESNAKRMLNLINQLLDFRKSEHGLLKLKRVYSDFVPFAKEVFLSFQSIARKKNIRYTFQSELDEAPLDFDRDQMEIVLCNLLSNAFKYTPHNGAIQLRIYPKGDWLAVDVEDDGIGLSEESIRNLFNRFYQVQNAQTAKMVGSGLGLAFSKNIVDLHEGEITVRSELGKGTCFTVLLQADPVDGAPADGPLAELAEAGAEGPVWPENNSLDISKQRKKETVLVVDDNEDIRAYLQSLLKEDFTILEAQNGLEALTITNRELPDLIICDVMMPLMDGITFCQEIKQQIATSHIPVILLTARSSVVYEVNGLQTGADDYITKPFNPIIVKTRIHTILENRKKLQEHYLNKVRFEPDTQQVNEVDLDALFIDKAIKLVNDNMQNEDFGIEDMVEHLFMSQSTLYRKIKSLTGLSLTGFIRSVKLKNAAQMILQDNMKLSQVAYEVGFNDYKHFRKSFQQQFGCLPSDYRAKILEGVKE
ncbi:hybrid sensor histidine kinase/response regulator transcription factor [Rudanella lutea]|uniref:hybrid sensor histidine kinase/response regulator transcription factor n=1 Tax=Rudanella lutea TaxID=451374 RepID=UPI00146E56DB|nr:hybrid sensor histidine kinase/response regulator transcription factor [Rudanella lutea]